MTAVDPTSLTLSQCEPGSRGELLAELMLLSEQAEAFWNSLSDADFFAAHGEQWSPAQNVRHLTKSTKPVVWTLKTPRVVLRAMFGKPIYPSRSYRQIVDRYLQVLHAGGQAGMFGPERFGAPTNPRSTLRAKLMDRWRRALQQLIDAAQRWDDAALDGRRVPHPLLGRLTVREMMLFTLYHHRHHTRIVMLRQPR